MEIKELINLSIQAQQNSYSPYSKFKVGASLLTKSGKIYLGANVENASYGATICAERNAINKAINDGEKDFDAICITCDKNTLAYPCGICRQVMVEFSPTMKVIVAKNENEYEIHSARELLPYFFTKE